MQKPHLVLQSEETSTEPLNQNINTPANKKTSKHDLNHKVSNFIREEIIVSYRPPQNTISELVFLNDLVALQSLIDNGDVDCNCRDNEGITCSWTPLYWAVKLVRTEIATLLLNNGANINLVVNDSDECCGTVLDLATIRGDLEMELLLRNFAEKEDVNLGQAFKAIRTKLRGKAPSFNFRSYNKKEDIQKTL